MNTLNALAAQGVKKESIAYILNDEGQVDGALVERVAQVIPMTNGCFTCNDEASTLSALKKIEVTGTVKLVFFEGFGIVSGDETKKFLESSGYNYEIVCVLDCKHLKKNQVRYLDVLTTQLKAATLGIGISKHADHMVKEDATTPDALDFIAEVGNHVPVFFIPTGGSLPSEMLDHLAMAKSSKHTGHEHHEHGMCACGHDHEHHTHEHEHDVHSIYPYSFHLRKEVKLDQIKNSLAGASCIQRIKGATEGRLFNAVFNDWRFCQEDNRRFITFYADRRIELARDIPKLVEFVEEQSQRTVEEEVKQSYELLREDNVPAEETVKEIEALLVEFPVLPVLNNNAGGCVQLITHPEILQLVKEISRRKSVFDTHFPRVIERCMEYWIKCAEYLYANQLCILASDIDTNMRELGISIAWWTERYGKEFSPALVGRVLATRPAHLVAKGFKSLSSLNSDPERAKWQCIETFEAVKFGVKHGEDREEMVKTLRHGLSLAHTPPSKEQWENAVKEFDLL